MRVIEGKGRRFGFSLIELLVTIAMVGVLSAGVAGLIGQGPRRSARDATRQADLGKVASALELMRNDLGGYPHCGGPASCVLTSAVVPAAYMNTIPIDPLGAPRQYTYRPFDSTVTWGICSGLERCVAFTLCAGLERNLIAVAGNPPCGSCGGAVNCSYRTTNP